MRYFLLIAAIGLAGCQEEDFKQNAYFRGENRNRVFVLIAPANVDAETVRSKAESLSHTDGRFTAAYIFREGALAPADYITRAPNYMAANQRMNADGIDRWVWRYIKNPNGDVFFTDCETDPSLEDCPQ